MYPVTLVPDEELALRQYLLMVPAVTAITSEIMTETKAQPVYPLVLIQAVGGDSIVPLAIDQPALQVDFLAGTKAEAKNLARTVQAAILAIANDTVPAGVLVSAWMEVRPSWLPDQVPVQPTPRYTSRFRIILHP